MEVQSLFASGKGMIKINSICKQNTNSYHHQTFCAFSVTLFKLDFLTTLSPSQIVSFLLLGSFAMHICWGASSLVIPTCV
jgi:hypothetical protein